MLSSLFLSVLAASLAVAAPSSSCQLVDSGPLPTSTPVPVSNNGTNSPAHFISGAWIAGWNVTNSSLSSVNWNKYSSMYWSFAYVSSATFCSTWKAKCPRIFSVTTPDSSVLSLDDSGPDLIPNFVEQAHQHDTMAGIAVGGWTGSRYFSQAVTPQNRSTFVKAVLDMVSKYQLDEINFE